MSAVVIVLCTLLAQGVSADEILQATTVGHAADVMDEPGLGLPVSNENLSEFSGRQDTFINNLDAQLIASDQTGNVFGNSILNSSLVNGANSISDNAFANSSGLVTVIQNSGNQVLIQNDLILNLTLK